MTRWELQIKLAYSVGRLDALVVGLLAASAELDPLSKHVVAMAAADFNRRAREAEASAKLIRLGEGPPLPLS